MTLISAGIINDGGGGGGSVVWETTADWDAAQAEAGVHHEQPAGTDWAAADVVEKGYPAADENGSALGGYWPFDEDSGTTATDVAGSNDGTVNGATVGDANGILGTTTYSFDATDDSVTAPYDYTWDNSPWSVSFWFHRDTDAMNQDEALISGDASPTGNFQWTIWMEDSNASVRFGDVGGSPMVSTSSTGLNDGTWHHVVVTYDGSGSAGSDGANIYLDGVDETVLDNSGLAPGSDATNQVVWGRSNNNEDRPYGPGELDETRFYERELSGTDVTALYDAVAGSSTLTTAGKTA